jgi:hypothetical protein
MKMLKRSVTVALLLFVGATVGMLIAQEVMHSDSLPAAEGGTAGVVDVGAPADAQSDPGPDDAVTSAVAPEEGSTAAGPETGRPETPTAGEADVMEVDTSGPESICVVDAIYFHNTLRCRTCKNIEEAAKAVVEGTFSDEMEAGRLRWSAINMEKRRQYVEAYGLVKPTLVLVRNVDEEEVAWAALDETWGLIRYESRFTDYVENETRTFLEACP